MLDHGTSPLSLQVDDFLNSLINYEKENIPEMVTKAVQPYLDNPEFDPDFIRSKSTAAAGLCAWVINIIRYDAISILLSYATCIFGSGRLCELKFCKV